MLFFFFAVITSQSIPRMDFTLTTVPHLGQRAGAFTTPPSIAMNSCPQQGHFALLIPVTIALPLLCFTASDATGIVHSVLHQLAAGKHGHSSNEQFDRKFQKILFHIAQSKMKSMMLSKKYQGQNWGKLIISLLKDWFIHNNKTGCRYITVDVLRP